MKFVLWEVEGITNILISYCWREKPFSTKVLIKLYCFQFEMTLAPTGMGLTPCPSESVYMYGVQQQKENINTAGGQDILPYRPTKLG